jgi:hypothetical protein
VRCGDLCQVLAPGPATAGQRGAVMGHFRRLGLAHPAWRDCRLAVTAALLDLDRVGSVNDLTGGQAGQLIRTLSYFRDARDLAVHLAWSAIQARTCGGKP